MSPISLPEPRSGNFVLLLFPITDVQLPNQMGPLYLQHRISSGSVQACGLQVQTAVTDILNKQLRTVDNVRY